MTSFAPVDHYYSGQGVVMAAERDAQGNPTGFIPLGNVSALTLSVATSVLEHKESHSGQRGTDKRITTETTVTFAMTAENFIAENLALALRGLNTEVKGATVTAEKHKLFLGRVIALRNIKVSAVTLTLETETLVPYFDEDTPFDYQLNADAGSIKFNDGKRIPLATLIEADDGSEIEVAYTFADQKRVDALMSGAKELMLRFEGLNTAEDNSPVIVEIFKASTDPLRELALIGDGIGQFQLEGSVLADVTRPTGSKYFKATQLV